MTAVMTSAHVIASAKRAGITVAELARRAGVSQSSITRWAKGKSVQLTTYQKIEEAIQNLPPPEPRA